MVPAGHQCVTFIVSLPFLSDYATVNGQPVSVTLSNDIAPGQYLIRHEIIALHLAVSPGGAEFYPSCTQVNIGGSQTGQPNQTVTFPGGYTDTEPGILDPDVSVSSSLGDQTRH